MKKLILYFHGKGGSADEAEYYKPFFLDCDVVGVDYRGTTPWETREEILSAYRWLKKKYDSISIVCNSIGAYFAMNALGDSNIERAYFISPVVDMERLILDLMRWANVTETELQAKKIIEMSDWGEPLSWKYLCYVREHPVSWDVPTEILYGEKDILIPFESISKFVKHTGANVTVMKGGEHWFHTEPQVRFHDAWIKQCIKQQTKKGE